MIKKIFKFAVSFLLLSILELNLYSVTVSVMPFRIPGNDDSVTNYNSVDGLARVFTDELERTRRLYATDYDLFVAYASDVDNYYSYEITSTNKILAVNYATNFFKTDYVLFGELFEISLSTNEKDNIDKAFISVMVELVDVRTMNIVTNISRSASYSMPTNRYSDIYKMDDAYFYESTLGRATIQVASNIASLIVSSLKYPPMHGAITRTETNNSFYINLGKNNEVMMDDIFEIYDVSRIYKEVTNVAQTNEVTNQDNNVMLDIGGDVVVEDIVGNPDENNETKKTNDTNTNNVTLFVKDEKDNNGEIEGLAEKEDDSTLNTDENEINTLDDTQNSENNNLLGDENIDNEILNENDENKDEIVNNNQNLEYADTPNDENIDNIKDAVFRSNNLKDSIKRWNYINRFNQNYGDIEPDEMSKLRPYVILKNKAGKMSYIETKIDLSVLGNIKKELLPPDFFSVYRPIATNDIGERFYLSEMLFKYKHFEEETKFVGYAKVVDLYDNFAILEIVNLSKEDFNKITTMNEKLVISDTNLINISPSKNTFKLKSGKTDYVKYSKFLQEEKIKKETEDNSHIIEQPTIEDEGRQTESDLIENSMIEEAIRREEERLQAERAEQERLERERIDNIESYSKEGDDNTNYDNEILLPDTLEDTNNNIEEDRGSTPNNLVKNEDSSENNNNGNIETNSEIDIYLDEENVPIAIDDDKQDEILIADESTIADNTYNEDENSDAEIETATNSTDNSEIDIYPDEENVHIAMDDDKQDEILIADESAIADNTYNEDENSDAEIETATNSTDNNLEDANKDSNEIVASAEDTATSADTTDTTTIDNNTEDTSGYKTAAEEINVKPLMRVILIRDK